MARLIYSAITSLDGYVNDEDGKFDWAAPDEEVHAYVNDLERPIGTYLYGRRMYEVMAAWDNPETVASATPAMRDFAAIWRAADKIVFSETLASVSTVRTHLERGLDAETIRKLKAESDRDLSVGGPGLAAAMLASGLVDELHLLAAPVVVGGGTRWLPGGLRLDLDLLDERRFSGGVVHLHYHVVQGMD
jgi:dihydrofolate reductase